MKICFGYPYPKIEEVKAAWKEELKIVSLADIRLHSRIGPETGDTTRILMLFTKARYVRVILEWIVSQTTARGLEWLFEWRTEESYSGKICRRTSVGPAK